MSRFEQVAKEVAKDSYLKEWNDIIQKALDDYRPAIPSVDEIIGTVAFQMLKRNKEMQIPKDDDLAFFAKILWVQLVQIHREIAVDKYYPSIEENLKKELHRKLVKLMIGAQK